MVSDEYIRMSREAKELQDDWEPKIGHIIHRVSGIGPGTDVVNHKDNIQHVLVPGWFKEFIWLPRQEDLIKIMENNWEHGRCELIGYFHNFSWNYIHDRCEKYDFNELWLMVLMEYIYNKRWDGNGWVKQ